MPFLVPHFSVDILIMKFNFVLLFSCLRFCFIVFVMCVSHFHVRMEERRHNIKSVAETNEVENRENASE